MNTGRMEAEVVRDSLLYCGGLLELSKGGQPLENKQALETYRRSIYYEVYPEDGGASQLSALFDAPNPLECYRRTRSIVPQQALALTNSDLVHQVSERTVRDWEARQTQSEDRDADRSQPQQFVKEMFETVLSRTPSDSELQVCLTSLRRQQRLSQRERSQAITEARQSLVRALLNHNDFVTVR